MILQALNGYYRRMADEGASDVAPEGFERKALPFLIVLNRQGEFVSIQDTRDEEGKKKTGRVFTLPKGVKKTSGVAANLLWDTPNYVLGVPKLDSKKSLEELALKAKEQQQCFIKNIHDRFPQLEQDEGLQAVILFLEGGDYAPLLEHPTWPEIAKTSPNLTFKLDSDETRLICERPAVLQGLFSESNSSDTADNKQICLVTGSEDIPVRLHTAIKGVWGAQSSGANIVSFNLDAFKSYGKEQGQNAPVGKNAEFAYTTVLNKLLEKGSRQRVQAGDCSTVFWAERKTPFEDIFADFFGGEKSKENPDQLNAAVRALFAAPEAGAPPLDDDYTPFFVLGLAPNAARIAVRFWYPGTVAEVSRHIRQHFDDCAIVHGPKQPEYLSLFRLLVTTATQGKSENIQPNLAGDVMKAILTGAPYPQTLLASAIRRCRAEQSKKDPVTGRQLENVPYPRAALIKACLTRASRYYSNIEQEVTMSLDTTNSNSGYRLGRLFATLEKIQEEASPGINSTIRDRFYSSASSTPVAVFSQLMKLKNHHLSKLGNRGRAINMEKLIGEIMAGLNDFPTHLSLSDQGRFAVGYYHQRQDFFKK